MGGSHILVSALSDMVGAGHVLTEAHDMSPFLTDWRGNFTGAALAVVRPATAAQVAAVVGWAQENSIAVVPQGGNTGLVGGSVPLAIGPPCVVVSTARLRAVRAIDTANRTLTVEAGCTLAAVQALAQEHGLLYPVSLAAEGTAQIGGTLATNAGGVQVLKYGNTRDQVLGVEVVLPDGRIWDGLQGLRKDNTGYDLRHLMIGSEGTLGIITAATLKLVARPRQTLVAWASTPTLAQAIALLGFLLDTVPDRIAAFEVVSDACMQLVKRHLGLAHPLTEALPWNILIEWVDTDAEAPLVERAQALLGQALAEQWLADVVIAQSEAQAAALWHIREHVPEAEKRQGKAVKHDVSLPVSAIAEFVATTDALLQAAFPDALIVNFGHLGDGNLHYNVTGADGATAMAIYNASARINAIVYDSVVRHGGSISAEHGIGQLKRSMVATVKSPAALAMMRSIKQALDPHNLMNPGKLL
jgi:FAD/FMN-containing dehydrogenase